MKKSLVTSLIFLVSASFCTQVYPGTEQRPILSEEEAGNFTKELYLQGWIPPNISIPAAANYTVGSEDYPTIQSAVNVAIKSKRTDRVYIKIPAGIYDEIVYISKTNASITLYGEGRDSTIIRFNLSATTRGSDYAKRVGKFFKATDRGHYIYSVCSNSSLIGTICSSVVWVRSPNVQIVNLTIENQSEMIGTDQAVALYAQEDTIQVSNCSILGHQDTFWAGLAANITTRGHVTDTLIAGDTDFVFGGGSTVFERCIFYAKENRTKLSYIFAPATPASHKYGYLVIDSLITGDESWFDSKGVRLARSWDIDVLVGGDYVPGVSANGQLVVRDSMIDDIMPIDAPYVRATTGREYIGNVSVGRDLNDNRCNRFWEYNNTILQA